uniref:Uncharacterized protein n=1 Tax=Vombatus ursinus TaxID=29139 RepID=A0A4X2L4Z0_VOMUR
MKFWITIRNLPYHTNPNRPIPSHTLHLRYPNSLLFSSPYLPRCESRLTHPQPPRQRSIYILHMPVPPHWPRNLLWLLPLQRNMKHRSISSTHSYSNCFRWLCTPMRTNILLRCNRNYQLIISHPLRRHHPSRMNLRWILRRQSHTDPILRLPFYPTFHCHSTSYRSPTIPS